MELLLSYIVLLIIVVFLLLGITYIANPSVYEYEKRSAYECGFEPFGDARSFFDAHFYIVGLLFIIFDLEVVFLIPFVASVESTGPYEYAGFLIFMFILLFGFYYEWCLGLLDWVRPSNKKE
jgi:NADH:ubiquinone oxidoreductase subunit 3 (subunit A)